MKVFKPHIIESFWVDQCCVHATSNAWVIFIFVRVFQDTLNYLKWLRDGWDMIIRNWSFSSGKLWRKWKSHIEFVKNLLWLYIAKHLCNFYYCYLSVALSLTRTRRRNANCRTLRRNSLLRKHSGFSACTICGHESSKKLSRINLDQFCQN